MRLRASVRRVGISASVPRSQAHSGNTSLPMHVRSDCEQPSADMKLKPSLSSLPRLVVVVVHLKLVQADKRRVAGGV